jgi:hypothetical protein
MATANAAAVRITMAVRWDVMGTGVASGRRALLKCNEGATLSAAGAAVTASATNAVVLRR